MEPTFLGCSGFPPPSASALVFTCFGGPAAWSATDACVALSIQRVNGNVVRARVVVHLLPRPVGERADFEPARVGCDFRKRLPGIGLGPAQARQPSVEASQFAVQR